MGPAVDRAERLGLSAPFCVACDWIEACITSRNQVRLYSPFIAFAGMWNIAHNMGGFLAPILAGTAAKVRSSG